MAVNSEYVALKHLHMVNKINNQFQDNFYFIMVATFQVRSPKLKNKSNKSNKKQLKIKCHTIDRANKAMLQQEINKIKETWWAALSAI